MLLLDENLSLKLVARLKSQYPGIEHVTDAGLSGGTDNEIWLYAKQKGLVIVSKDKDYLAFAQNRGHPPKVILLTIGNCRVADIEAFMLSQHTPIVNFLNQSKTGILQL